MILAYLGCCKLKATQGVKTTSPAGAKRYIDTIYLNPLSRLLLSSMDKLCLQFWCLNSLRHPVSQKGEQQHHNIPRSHNLPDSFSIGSVRRFLRVDVVHGHCQSHENNEGANTTDGNVEYVRGGSIIIVRLINTLCIFWNV
jgi:hypothetical protein